MKVNDYQIAIRKMLKMDAAPGVLASSNSEAQKTIADIASATQQAY
jgi:hypothetical protein